MTFTKFAYIFFQKIFLSKISLRKWIFFGGGADQVTEWEQPKMGGGRKNHSNDASGFSSAYYKNNLCYQHIECKQRIKCKQLPRHHTCLTISFLRCVTSTWIYDTTIKYLSNLSSVLTLNYSSLRMSHNVIFGKMMPKFSNERIEAWVPTWVTLTDKYVPSLPPTTFLTQSILSMC